MRLKDYGEQGLELKHLLVIDVHCHLGVLPNPFMPYQDEGEQLIQFNRTMKRVGVDYSIVSMIRGLATGDLSANLDLARVMETHPNLLGWITYNPHLSKESIAMADQCRGMSDRFVGFKVHPEINSYPINGEKYKPMFEYADAHGLMVQSHAWGPNSNPHLFTDIPKHYRKLKLLIAHLGGLEPGISDSLALANRYDNVYMDLTGSFVNSARTLENFVRRTDTSKLLFSSDTVATNLCWDLGNLLFARIDDSLKEEILGLNAKKLLEQVLAFPIHQS